MRHFADELRDRGFEVDYHELAPTMRHGLERHLREHRPAEIRLMKSGEHGRSDALAAMVRDTGIDCDVVANNAFLSDRETFRNSIGIFSRGTVVASNRTLA